MWAVRDFFQSCFCIWQNLNILEFLCLKNVKGAFFSFAPEIRFSYVAKYTFFIYICNSISCMQFLLFLIWEKAFNANLNNSLKNFILHCKQKPCIRYFKKFTKEENVFCNLIGLLSCHMGASNSILSFNLKVTYLGSVGIFTSMGV